MATESIIKCRLCTSVQHGDEFDPTESSWPPGRGRGPSAASSAVWVRVALPLRALLGRVPLLRLLRVLWRGALLPPPLGASVFEPNLRASENKKEESHHHHHHHHLLLLIPVDITRTFNLWLPHFFLFVNTANIIRKRNNRCFLNSSDPPLHLNNLIILITFLAPWAAERWIYFIPLYTLTK